MSLEEKMVLPIFYLNAVKNINQVYYPYSIWKKTKKLAVVAINQ